MIHQPVSPNGLPKVLLCAKCGGRIQGGDAVITLTVKDVSSDGGSYSTFVRSGEHPTIHYRCIEEEDRPIVVNTVREDGTTS